MTRNKLIDLFIYFIIYSFIGWGIETVYFYFSYGHFVKRGFLISPLCAVYGIASLLVILIAKQITSRPSFLFLISSVVITVLELITGILLTYVLNRRMWDYSMQPCNFLGIICLRNTIIWGILSYAIIYVLHPFFTKHVGHLSLGIKHPVCCFFSLILSIDILVSAYSSLQGISNIELISEFYFHKIRQLSYITDRALRVLR